VDGEKPPKNFTIFKGEMPMDRYDWLMTFTTYPHSVPATIKDISGREDYDEFVRIRNG